MFLLSVPFFIAEAAALYCLNVVKEHDLLPGGK